MKALQKFAAQPGARLIEIDPPSPKSGEVLLKIHANSICGTDLHIYGWDAWAASRIKPPMIFGHECAGEVVAIGENVSGINIGDRASVETHIACGQCYQCRTNRSHICQNLRILGVDTTGVFAGYAAVPAENLWLNDPELPWEIASIQEPFGNAVQTVMAGPGVSAKNILITGCGPIGLMGVMAARACGAGLIIVSDINEKRLKLALDYGADIAINPLERDLPKLVRDATKNQGVDALLEFSGSPAAIRQGLSALTFGGHVSLLGLSAKPIEIDISNDIVFKAATVIGISGRKMFETWYQVRSLISTKRVDLAKLISHQMPIDDFEQAFDLLARGEAVKVILYP